MPPARVGLVATLGILMISMILAIVIGYAHAHRHRISL
jgi:hypothetical protein